MKESTANTLWATIGPALFYFVFNSVAKAQGWPFKLPGLGFESFDRYGAAFIATPVGLLGSVVLLCVGAAYARASKGEAIRRRLPVPFKLGDPDSTLLHATQLAAYILFPAVALANLFNKYLGGQFCRRVANTDNGCGLNGYKAVGEYWEHFRFVPLSEASRSRAFIYQGGADYWPFWEAVGVSMLWIIYAAALLWFLFSVLKRQK